MTVYIERAKRIRHFVEPNGSFCAEQTLGSFTDVQAREDSVKLTLERPMETPMLLQQHIDGYPSKVFLPKSATLDLATNLRALPARGSGLVSVSTVPDRFMLLAAFGGEFIGQGTTILSTSTTTVLNTVSAAGLREGSAIACATGAGGALECREIKQISTNAVTVKSAFSSIPANGSVVYAPYTVYLDNTDGSLNQSLQVAIEGLNSVDKWLLKGGAPKASPKFEFAPGSVPKITWSWQFADWKLADGTETTMNLSSTPISDQAYSDVGINAVMDSEFRTLSPSGVLAGTLIDASSITMQPNIKYGPIKTPAGTNTIKQWVRLRDGGPPVTGDFKIPYEDASWRASRDTEADAGFAYQIGSSVANGAVYVTAPRVGLDNFQREEVDGIAGQTISFYGKLDNKTNTNSNNLQRSAFRIHLF